MIKIINKFYIKEHFHKVKKNMFNMIKKKSKNSNNLILFKFIKKISKKSTKKSKNYFIIHYNKRKRKVNNQ